ncbi:hypothetical protein ACVH8U_004141 [Yersinia enterocolitica]|nr:hypothetical protein [Yersinia enterocolitica]HDL8287357.1 hypothetical protein [Yersinia enterocolitica]HEN3279886.1 hypothetical protein [Yersinia enterocolitica]
MKVTCTATRLSSHHKQVMGLEADEEPNYPFVVGETYTVLGIHTQAGYYAGTMLHMPSPGGYIIPTPLCLFEVIDDRPSRYWRIQKYDDYHITLWPEEFYQEYFHDDLSDGVPEVIEIYNSVVKRLEKEFD